MSHYQERLEKDLAHLRHEIGDVGRKVREAIHASVHALLTRNRQQASATILGDLAINRQVRRLDQRCHAFVALHLPSAGHLRFVSSVLRLNIALERIGDYAVTIAREVPQLENDPPTAVARDIELLASQAERILKQSLEAFLEGNAEMARGIKSMASQVDLTYDKVFSDLVETGQGSSQRIEDLFALLGVFGRLSRVSDQAKNICEETVFVATGETKAPKVYRVLFVDERDDGLTQMAVAYARKAFPEAGRFTSAGLEPADDIDARYSAFLDDKGHDVRELEPILLDATYEELAAQHVIVSFAGDLAGRVDVPFHTVLLEWAVASPQNDDPEVLAEAYREISSHLSELMVILRGEEDR